MSCLRIELTANGVKTCVLELYPKAESALGGVEKLDDKYLIISSEPIGKGWAVQPGRFMRAGAKADDIAALKEKVTLDLDGTAPLFELLQNISKKHKVTFVIREDLFKEAGEPDIRERKVGKVSFKDAPLSKVLTDVLKPLGATYEVVKDAIVIKPAGMGAP